VQTVDKKKNKFTLSKHVRLNRDDTLQQPSWG